jgi:SAM-dependent methyltransferase
MTILECGCGPGLLWRSNVNRLPANCHITLTDLSDGMIAEARDALADAPSEFQFETADIQELPYADYSFDIVVANHMLYHVPNLSQGLSEVRRVLKPNGRFFAATNGNNHMKELKQIGDEMTNANATFIEKLGYDNSKFIWQLACRLENGAELLAPFFDNVDLAIFADNLEVTEAEPLANYIKSTFRLLNTGPEILKIVDDTVAQKINAEKVIHITKETGLFIAHS